MTTVRPDEPLDELDLRILAAVRDLWTAADPPPADLVDRVRGAVALAGAFLGEPTVAVCRQRTGSEDVGRITFDSDALTISLSVGVNLDGSVRMDGRLSPPGSHDVELRTDDQRLCTRSDVHGRFTINGLRHGPAHLIVSATDVSLTTPSITL
ncbi:hypothetical protein [Kutzneria sp. CA-103260]|uniref:hypothetical protein n=1 Tax=Kutzneria sp. CA-103260 TaxID=2802641 RepID=UPI001BADFBAE|nr:hypothetical protein [Kutzneria sp. CA-103260]QUQ66708.1 hypothetical protein JJ691_44360 [Kutzneria sp. CA-103260]